MSSFDDTTVSQNKEYFNEKLAYLTSCNDDEIKKILDEFKKDSDLFYIGKNEIQKYTESIKVVIKNVDVKLGTVLRTILVPMSSPFYSEIKKLGGIIGRKYFKFNEL